MRTMPAAGPGRVDLHQAPVEMSQLQREPGENKQRVVVAGIAPEAVVIVAGAIELVEMRVLHA